MGQRALRGAAQDTASNLAVGQPLKEAPANLNARTEDVHEKPMFCEAFRRRLCITEAAAQDDILSAADALASMAQLE